MTVEEVENQAMRLSVRERAVLVERLLASLEGDATENVEAAWLDEARRRRSAFRSGQIPAVPADSAIRDARAKLG